MSSKEMGGAARTAAVSSAKADDGAAGGPECSPYVSALISANPGMTDDEIADAEWGEVRARVRDYWDDFGVPFTPVPDDAVAPEKAFPRFFEAGYPMDESLYSAMVAMFLKVFGMEREEAWEFAAMNRGRLATAMHRGVNPASAASGIRPRP